MIDVSRTLKSFKPTYCALLISGFFGLLASIQFTHNTTDNPQTIPLVPGSTRSSLDNSAYPTSVKNLPTILPVNLP